MNISSLEAFNIEPSVINLWKEKYSDKLLPIQELAVKQCHVLDGNSLLVVSPTSSGKTFIAEMAAIKVASEKKRVIFAVPLKSLAEEKFRQFQAVYAQFGIRTVIATRDRYEFDRAIEDGHFEIAIMVYEKVNSLLIKRSNFLDTIGLAVIDELQMLGDESRGTDLNLLLTKLLLHIDSQMPDKKMQLLGLSAVLGNAESIAKWLGIPLLGYTERPVELRKGVLYNGIFQYQEHNSKQKGEEIFFAPKPASRDRTCPARTGEGRSTVPIVEAIPKAFGTRPHLGQGDPALTSDDDPYNTDQVLSLVQFLAEVKNEASIIFVPKKQLSRLWANWLAARVTLPRATHALQALDESEPSLVKDELHELLEHGVAYHNADLNSEFREIIETYFRNGEIRILVATGTLGQGVNLAAKNAVIVPHTVKYQRQQKLISNTMMGKAQFENCSGRVGRFGIEPEFGRAILVAGNKNQRVSYWLWYIHHPFEPVTPQLLQENLESLCLKLVAAGWAKNVMEVTTFIKRMYFSADSQVQPESNQAPAPQPDTRDKLINAIQLAQQWGLIGTNARNELEVTAVGQSTAIAGISFDTAHHFAQWLEHIGSRTFSELELLLVCALSPDAAHFLFPLSQREWQHSRYRTELMKLIFEVQEETRKVYLDLLNQSYPPAKEKTAAMKKALVLYHWIQGIPTDELERGYRAYYGAISNLAAEFSWLIQSLAGIARAIGWNEEAIARFYIISDRLRYGVQEGTLLLARLNIPGLGRMRCTQLVQQGYDTPESLTELDLDTLTKCVTRPVAERIKRKLNANSLPKSDGTASPNPEYDILSLLGIPSKKRTLLQINSREIELPNRSYLVLLKLAVARKKAPAEVPPKVPPVVNRYTQPELPTNSQRYCKPPTETNGWLHRDELDAPDNFGRNISRLRCELKQHLKDRETILIENDSQGYYRLNLPPENILIDIAKFNQHWNKEFHEIVSE